jgi:cation diffusion facilitator CzcD-associated flavoprotein CzcO
MLAGAMQVWLSAPGGGLALSCREPGPGRGGECRAAIGGTWDLFRYPGIRPDSDMYTMGYDSKPWCEPKAIADGASILASIREAALEDGVLQFTAPG